jgi:hypothetical protein
VWTLVRNPACELRGCCDWLFSAFTSRCSQHCVDPRLSRKPLFLPQRAIFTVSVIVKQGKLTKVSKTAGLPNQEEILSAALIIR